MALRFLKHRFTDNPLSAIVMIALTAIITHGILISRLGYYYDDWYMLWSGAARGPDSLAPLFSLDRPFMGIIYTYTYRLFQDHLWGWHLATLAIRIAGAGAFYWIFNLVWPQLKRYSTLAGILFVVFPGFLAEPNAATKINHLIGFGAALFSIAFTLRAERARRGWKYALIGLSLLLMAVYVWIYEYMIGLEIMRLALLFWVRWQNEREKLFVAAKKLALAYLPYVGVIGLFLFWRVVIFDSTRPATDLQGLVFSYRANYMTMIPRLFFQGITDFFSASTFAWFVQPYSLLVKVNYGEIVIAVLFALAVGLLIAGYSYALRRPETQDPEVAAPITIVLIGALIVLAAVFPVVLFNRRIDLMDPYKAYALHPSAGAIFMVVGLVAMLKSRFRRPALILLICASVAVQSMNIQEWAKFWDMERGMWWQLTWRAPNIQDNTVLMAYLPPGFGYQQDYEVWGPVNLIYRPGPAHIPAIPSEVLNADTALFVFQGISAGPHVRDIYVPKDYNNFLLISQPTVNSCIHIVDGAMPVYSTSERPIVEWVGGKSNIGLIDPSATPPIPPVNIFGKEPEHGWCYYFQQASLARQTGDWQKIVDLYQAASTANLKPADLSEYFVFIEGLVNQGDTDAAIQIVQKIIKDKNNTTLQYSFCSSLSAAPAYPDSYGYRRDQISQVVCQ